jgi:hypothetical protein
MNKKVDARKYTNAAWVIGGFLAFPALLLFSFGNGGEFLSVGVFPYVAILTKLAISSFGSGFGFAFGLILFFLFFPLAVLQFPAYVFIVNRAKHKEITAIAIVIIHVIGVFWATDFIL